MKRFARPLGGIIGISLLLTSASAAPFRVAWQRTNNFQTISFGELNSPIVRIDGRGNVYLAAVDGRIEGQGVLHDYVVVKRNAFGRLLWQTHLPLGHQAGVNEFELDRFGNAYVTGSGGTAKFSASGRIAWAVPFGDREDGWKDFQDIDVDHTGDVYVTGHSLRDRNSLSSVVITTIKYSATGTQRWVQQYSGGQIFWSPSHQHVEVDESGDVYVAGEVRPHPAGGEEWAIIKYNGDGHEVWTRRYDGAGFEAVHDLALDRRGELLITGYDGGHVTLKYDAHGNRLWEAHQPALGSGGGRIGLDLFGSVYVRGWENDEETTTHSLLKLDSRGRHQWTKRLTSDFGWGHAFAVDKLGNSYLGAKLSIRKFDRHGRPVLTIPVRDEASTMEVDRAGHLLESNPRTTTKFIAR